MLVQNNLLERDNKEEQDVYTFSQEANVWYIHLPWGLETGWDQQHLRMTEGAHKFLNTLSNGAGKLRLRISTEPLQNAGVLELVEHCEAPRGGAIYLFLPAKADSQDMLFWICDLALFVFGDMPDRIYVQRLRARIDPIDHLEKNSELHSTRILQ